MISDDVRRPTANSKEDVLGGEAPEDLGGLWVAPFEEAKRLKHERFLEGLLGGALRGRESWCGTFR